MSQPHQVADVFGVDVQRIQQISQHRNSSRKRRFRRRDVILEWNIGLQGAAGYRGEQEVVVGFCITQPIQIHGLNRLHWDPLPHAPHLKPKNQSSKNH